VSETTTREKWLEGVNLQETPSGAGEVLDRPLPPSPRERWLLLSLLAILLLGAVLRFYGLGFQSLSEGELAGWDLSNRGTLPQVIEGVRGGIHPPLYFLMLRFAQWILGDAEWALRLPSAIAGSLCIPAIYLLGRRLYSEREGLIEALFLAVLWAPVY
jgi:mannosyltransferase